MPFYQKVGQIPPKRHILFNDSDGNPCFEEFIGEEGFDGAGSLVYHRGVPSALSEIVEWDRGDQSVAPNLPLRPRHHRLPDLFANGPEGDLVRNRKTALGNADCRIKYAVVDQPSPLYSDGIGDEVVFIEEGSGTLESLFGTLEFKQGDNVLIPRTAIHRWVPNGTVRALIVEGTGHIHPPAKHRSVEGQFLEGSPMTERDIRTPEGPLLADPAIADKDTDVYVQHWAGSEVAGSIFTYDHHPFDVVGWDGYLFPYAFNYHDFAAWVGQTLLPPPTYQVFAGDGFVICNFVPRPLEYHEKAIKVPYYHSNVDSDEVMFYFAGATAAREGSGIVTGSISLHPAAYTHGAMRQAYLDSVNATESKEMAFMIDTFKPLGIGAGGRDSEVESYPWTWAGRHGKEDA